MKKNEEAMATLILQAIKEAGSDFALSSAKSYLAAAYNEVTKVHNKRVRREKNFKQMEEEAKKKQMTMEERKKKATMLDQMYAMLQNGLKKLSSPENEDTFYTP